MQCAFHTDTKAVTLCAGCARALCQQCTASSRKGRVCAAGCEVSPRTIIAAPEIVLPAAYHDGPAGDDYEVTPFTRWLRSGAATFLVGSAACTSAHLALLAVVGCLASFFCLCNAWRSYRAIRLWP